MVFLILRILSYDASINKVIEQIKQKIISYHLGKAKIRFRRSRSRQGARNSIRIMLLRRSSRIN
ncbi:MAG: hypothetical protein WBE34_13190, partial [Candidatus Nitrosopolaris sp.]